MNLTALVDHSGTTADLAGRVALRLRDNSITHADLRMHSIRVAAELRRRGVVAGDRVALALPNIPEFAYFYYGILRLGAVVVPINPLSSGRELDYYLKDSAATILVIDGSMDSSTGDNSGRRVETISTTADYIDGLVDPPDSLDAVDCAPGDTAVILYTSGTTGRPKGAELTHHNLLRNSEVVLTELLQLTPSDVVFGGLPLFHSFGQTVTLNAVMRAGASVTLMPRFQPAEATALLKNHEVSVFAGVPTMFNALLSADSELASLPRLRICISGGAALPQNVLSRFEARFPCKIFEGYGLSETSPLASFNRPGKSKLGSIGTPVEGVQMTVIDDQAKPVGVDEIGEIAVKGHNVMKGYWRRPDATKEALSADGWFRTGDVGRQDADGFFFIVDRKKDMIIRGGHNVYPREVEEVLYEHPDVIEAAVVGFDHPDLGEEVGAAVVLRRNSTVTAEQLRDYVKKFVAPYKYPRVIWIEDSLPKGPTGKVLKQSIAMAQRP